MFGDRVGALPTRPAANLQPSTPGYIAGITGDRIALPTRPIKNLQPSKPGFIADMMGDRVDLPRRDPAANLQPSTPVSAGIGDQAFGLPPMSPAKPQTGHGYVGTSQSGQGGLVSENRFKPMHDRAASMAASSLRTTPNEPRQWITGLASGERPQIDRSANISQFGQRGAIGGMQAASAGPVDGGSVQWGRESGAPGNFPPGHGHQETDQSPLGPLFGRELGAIVPPSTRPSLNLTPAQLDRLSFQQLSNLRDLYINQSRTLDVLEQYLTRTQAGLDNTLSVLDLAEFLNRPGPLGTISPAGGGPSELDLQLAAIFLRDNRDRFDSLSSAGHQGAPDIWITLANLHARQLEVNPQIYAGNPLAAIEEAFRTGNEVDFVNYSRPVAVGTAYQLLVDGKPVHLNSELSFEDTINGIRLILDTATTMPVRDGVRRFPNTLVFKKGAGPLTSDGNGGTGNSHGRYNSEHLMTIYDGLSRLGNDYLYHHEIAHGIARDLRDKIGPLKEGANDIVESLFGKPLYQEDAIPEGWTGVYNAAVANGNLVSPYANKNPQEGFAEAFALYLAALSQGPAALQTFRTTYPLQTEFLEQRLF